MFAMRSLDGWSRAASLGMTLAALTGCAHLHLDSLSPMTVDMTPPSGSQIDPRAPVVIEARGWGTRLAKVEVHDDKGEPWAGTIKGKRFTLRSPLAFGTRYRIRATVENAWLQQSQTHDLQITTVAIPRLEGPTQRKLEPDGSVTLQFDQPVGRLAVTGSVRGEIQADDKHRTFRVAVSGYPPNQTVALQFEWATLTDVPLPPFQIALTTPPALDAEANLQGKSNIGIALPLQITFSEPLSDPGNVGRQISITDREGKVIEGHWHWVGERRVRFTPKPHWPATNTVQVRPQGLRGVNGGVPIRPLLGEFTTGPDRRIFVYLDAQRVAAVENGRVVRAFNVSTGKATTPTTTGSFYIYARYPLKTMRSRAKAGEPGHYIVENVPYAQFFHQDLALHGAWWHNGFGRPASHGCVNIATRKYNRRWPSAPEDAGWLYEWATLGVPVNVVRSSSGSAH